MSNAKNGGVTARKRGCILVRCKTKTYGQSASARIRERVALGCNRSSLSRAATRSQVIPYDLYPGYAERARRVFAAIDWIGGTQCVPVTCVPIDHASAGIARRGHDGLVARQVLGAHADIASR